ncbi:hypothetical protein METUNv1_00520 [Methyloversatilis universalis FAM5]|uniref:Thymidylate kinase n=1 Tax=Methyloversatilis universalis (strain ATCC BAA-1314 / DSM 25237 / JCM 13912 / CCUG 52030 / FAM5) TaxID=1000565 RepID=F5R884_METUF|nr:hypothetical protein [Methyloversatilis universalis]EGK73342.1 hypothetical protein METUNv1_00520 [Methyloversatilis universalis FAM5]
MSALLVILEGPQGCGKTTAAPFIAQAFGCTDIYADEPSRRAVETALYEGRRVLACVSGNFFFAPTDEAAPVIRISIEGDRPTPTLMTLLAALEQPAGCMALQTIAERHA